MVERDGTIVIADMVLDTEVDNDELIYNLADNAVNDLDRIEGLIIKLPTMSSAQVEAIMIRLKRIENILVGYEDVDAVMVKVDWLKETFNQAVNVKWQEENQPVELVG